MAPLDIPPMPDWQAFERLCRDLCSRLWNDPDARMHGRSGQQQHGVDVYGRPGRGPEWAGVQCKLRSQIAGTPLTRGQIEAEARKAEDFEPKLSSFVVATTASRDADVQKAAREITDEQVARGAFPVSVWAWEDILEELEAHPDLVAKHLHLPIQLPDDGSGSVRDEYLRAQWSRLLPVPMLGVGRGAQEDVPLSAVYTALDVTAEIRPGGKGHGGPAAEGLLEGVGLRGDRDYLERLTARVRKEGEEKQEEDYWRRCTALEAAAAVPGWSSSGSRAASRAT